MQPGQPESPRGPRRVQRRGQGAQPQGTRRQARGAACGWRVLVQACARGCVRVGVVRDLHRRYSHGWVPLGDWRRHRRRSQRLVGILPHQVRRRVALPVPSPDLHHDAEAVAGPAAAAPHDCAHGCHRGLPVGGAVGGGVIE